MQGDDDSSPRLSQPRPSLLPKRFHWRSADTRDAGAPTVVDDEEERPLLQQQGQWTLPKQLLWTGAPHGEAEWRIPTSDACVIVFSGLLFGFIPNRVDWRTPDATLATWSSLAPVHLVLTIVIFSLGTLLIAGPYDVRVPLLLKIGHVGGTAAQIMLVGARWLVVHSRTPNPGLQEAMSYITPLINALAGTVQTILMCAGRMGTWAGLRARTLTLASVGFGTVLTLWFCTEGEATAFPPGPTTLRSSLATWACILCIGLGSHLRRRRWVWQLVPGSLKARAPRPANDIA